MPNSIPDYEKMQRDAERRLREMNRRAERAVQGGDIPPVPNFSGNGRRSGRQNTPPQNRPRPEERPQNTDRRPTTEPQPIKSPEKGGLLSKLKGFDLLKMLNFKNIRMDSDVIVIIALIFLLSTEDTDELLLLALVYIML